MLINKDSRSWILICLLIFAAATAAYVPYARRMEMSGGPSGGTWYGIAYASVGSAMMLFALLLGLKKRVRTMRIGRAYIWLQGHIWFGLLSYPIILYHAGFRWGQPWGFTWILMWLFTIVVVSGIVGVAIQQFMPAKMLRDVQYETIYEQIDHVIAQMRDDADAIVKNVTQASGGEAFEVESVPAGALTATLPETSVLAAKTLNDFHVSQVRPYLTEHIPAGSKLGNAQAARVVFDQMRASLPKAMQEPLNDLALIVEERRQMADQKRMHHVLHGWLIVHVPLSYALMLLAAWHAVEAVRFKSPHW